ncbi:MAG: acetylornithine transaminase [Euryarchaeota archaeon]|nr:acetylornithine transaminase [Euryarchaeota archaeon]
MYVNEIFKREKIFIAQTYARQPIVLVGGRGISVKDIEGKEYLDFVAGIAVNCLGYGHPAVIEAIKAQSAKLIHTSNLYYTLPQIELAELLIKNSFKGKVFICNSGTEAVEGAIKLARKATKKKEIIATEGAFHGRTLGALSATGEEKYKKDFEPLVPGFKHVQFGNSKAVENAITNDTAAVIVEPIQGEHGIIVPPGSYLVELREICDKHNVLLILDEVQTGIGRTGKMFAFQHFGIEPDIVALAKGFGGGFPIGAFIGKTEIIDSFQPGAHASTFGGNPLACAVAKAVIETIIREKLIDHVAKIGAYFKERLKELVLGYNSIKEVRGLGLLLGMELAYKGDKIVDLARENGLLINCTADTTLRFVPPFIVQKEHIDKAISILDKVFKEQEAH